MEKLQDLLSKIVQRIDDPKWLAYIALIGIAAYKFSIEQNQGTTQDYTMQLLVVSFVLIAGVEAIASSYKRGPKEEVPHENKSDYIVSDKTLFYNNRNLFTKLIDWTLHTERMYYDLSFTESSSENKIEVYMKIKQIIVNNRTEDCNLPFNMDIGPRNYSEEKILIDGQGYFQTHGNHAYRKDGRAIPIPIKANSPTDIEYSVKIEYNNVDWEYFIAPMNCNKLIISFDKYIRTQESKRLLEVSYTPKFSIQTKFNERPLPDNRVELTFNNGCLQFQGIKLSWS